MTTYPSITVKQFRQLPLMDGGTAGDGMPFLSPWLVKQLTSPLQEGQMVFYLVRRGTAMEVQAAVIEREKL
jgi:hypothetical protein